MTVLSATAAGSEQSMALAHGIHYAIVAAGIVGILALLVPCLHERRGGIHHARTRTPRDVHEARVMLLRAEISSGALGTGTRGHARTLDAPAPAPQARLVLGCSRAVLVVGAAVNVAFIGLWAMTRTLGLPVLMPEPEAVGPWDVACVAWQVVVVVACLRLLCSTPEPGRLAAWHRWDERVVVLALGSAALLAALSVSGLGG